MAEPKIRFRRDDGSSYPAWNNKCFGDLFKKNNERNGDQFSEDRTISIASMSFSPNGNGADANSLSAYKVLRVGDVAFEGHENKEFSHGRFVMNDIGDGIMSPRFSCMRPITPMVNGFWKYYIHSEAVMRDILIRSTKKGTMMHELVFDDFFKQSIDVPCLEEQQKIADFLSAVDEVISTSEAEVKNLETQKKAVMKKIFSQEVRFKKDDGTEFPEWEESTLGDLAYLRGRIGFRGYTRDDLVEKGNGVISLSPSNIMDGFSTYNSNTYISFFKYEESPEIKVSVNDILFTKTGSTVGKIGYVKELPEAATINPQIALITANGCDPYYLCLAMQSDNNVAFVREITVGGAIPTLSQEELKKMLIPLPSKDEQRLIAEFLSDFDEAITAAKKELELWKELKKGLLQQMFM